MPYVSKDDIMAYIPQGISLQQGVATTVEIELFKDYLNNQLNAADADSIVVTLYNSLGQKTYQYANPVVPGQTDRLELGAPASATQGIISFDITAAQAANLAQGNVFAQVTITYSNYYPAAKTYVLPQLLIGTNPDSSVPGGEGSGEGSGNSGGFTGSASNDVGGLSPYVIYDVSHVDGSQPDIKSVSFDNEDPTLVTEIIFYNLDKSNHRNVYLENFLENRIANGVSGTITIVDADNAKNYSVYNISSYSRINAEANGGDDNDNDYTKIVVSYEDNSYTPIEMPYKWAVGDSISYTLDAFGGASGAPGQQQPGQDGSSGTSGVDGADGRNGDNGIDGDNGSSGTSGVDGIDGNDGANGIDGNDGSSGTSGINGVDGDNGTSGTSGVNGSSGTSGVNGIDGDNGSSGTSGINGIDGDNGTSGTSGVNGTSGTSGVNGIDGDNGTSGTSGVNGIDGDNGTSGTSGVNGIDGDNGTSGTSGVNGSSGTSGISGTAGTSGTSGVDGPQGPPGMGITFKGAVPTYSSLPPTAGLTIGDAYITDDTDHLYVWNGVEWVDGGSIQGPAGAEGTSGTSGAEGTSGTSGVNGTSGTSGVSGENGSSGTSGINGADGNDGSSGTSGINGADGDNGSSGTSGINGIDGNHGSSGTSGINGADGDNGSSGTSGVNGSSGTSGVSGENGSSGTSGINGVDGDNGSSGTSGVSGDNGSSGTSGINGVNGNDGSSGTSGINGVDGANGNDGSSGTSGNDGVGIPSGGTSGQVLTKVDSSLYNVTWSDPTGASGAGYTKYLLRLNYDTQEALLAGTTSHSFVSTSGYETTGASITAVTSGATGSVTVQFNENNPPISVMVMAYNPTDDTYKVHHYDKDAANTIINTSAANFTAIGNNQYEPNFFGNFTVGMTLDTRQDFMKFGNSVSSGFPPVTKNAHVYVIFVF